MMGRFQPLEEAVLFRPISHRLAIVLTRLGFHPNHVSMLGFIVACAVSAGSVVLYGWGWHGRFVVAAAFWLVFLIDKIDGDLARARGIASSRGAYLDSFLDRLGELVVSVAIGYAAGFPPPLLLILGTFGPMLHYAHLYMFWHYAGETSFFPTSSLRQRTLRNLFAYNRAKHFLLLAGLSAVGMLHYAFWIFSLLIPYTVCIFLMLFIRDQRLQGSSERGA